MNKAILIGRLVREVELKTINTSGASVVNNAIAVSRFRTSNTGERLEETLFIDVVFFNRLAEIVSQYLRKGSKLMVEGYLQQQNWVDTQTNQNRSKIQLVVENMEMLDSKPADEAPRANYSQNNNFGQNTYQKQANSSQNNPYASYEKKREFPENNYEAFDDAEIPF